eukprot:m51a1_g8305 hypothetical protein (957) ;mRNA; r:59925-64339
MGLTKQALDTIEALVESEAVPAKRARRMSARASTSARQAADLLDRTVAAVEQTGLTTGFSLRAITLLVSRIIPLSAEQPKIAVRLLAAANARTVVQAEAVERLMVAFASLAPAVQSASLRWLLAQWPALAPESLHVLRTYDFVLLRHASSDALVALCCCALARIARAADVDRRRFERAAYLCDQYAGASVWPGLLVMRYLELAPGRFGAPERLGPVKAKAALEDRIARGPPGVEPLAKAAAQVKQRAQLGLPEQPQPESLEAAAARSAAAAAAAAAGSAQPEQRRPGRRARDAWVRKEALERVVPPEVYSSGGAGRGVSDAVLLSALRGVDDVVQSLGRVVEPDDPASSLRAPAGLEYLSLSGRLEAVLEPWAQSCLEQHSLGGAPRGSGHHAFFEVLRAVGERFLSLPRAVERAMPRLLAIEDPAELAEVLRALPYYRIASVASLEHEVVPGLALILARAPLATKCAAINALRELMRNWGVKYECRYAGAFAGAGDAGAVPQSPKETADAVRLLCAFASKFAWLALCDEGDADHPDAQLASALLALEMSRMASTHRLGFVLDFPADLLNRLFLSYNPFAVSMSLLTYCKFHREYIRVGEGVAMKEALREQQQALAAEIERKYEALVSPTSRWSLLTHPAFAVVKRDCVRLMQSECAANGLDPFDPAVLLQPGEYRKAYMQSFEAADMHGVVDIVGTHEAKESSSGSSSSSGSPKTHQQQQQQQKESSSSSGSPKTQQQQARESGSGSPKAQQQRQQEAQQQQHGEDEDEDVEMEMGDVRRPEARTPPECNRKHFKTFPHTALRSGHKRASVKFNEIPAAGGYPLGLDWDVDYHTVKPITEFESERARARQQPSLMPLSELQRKKLLLGTVASPQQQKKEELREIEDELDTLRRKRSESAGCRCRGCKCSTNKCPCFKLGLPCILGVCDCNVCLNPFDERSYSESYSEEFLEPPSP